MTDDERIVREFVMHRSLGPEEVVCSKLAELERQLTGALGAPASRASECGPSDWKVAAGSLWLRTFRAYAEYEIVGEAQVSYALELAVTR